MAWPLQLRHKLLVSILELGFVCCLLCPEPAAALHVPKMFSRRILQTLEPEEIYCGATPTSLSLCDGSTTVPATCYIRIVPPVGKTVTKVEWFEGNAWNTPHPAAGQNRRTKSPYWMNGGTGATAALLDCSSLGVSGGGWNAIGAYIYTSDGKVIKQKAKFKTVAPPASRSPGPIPSPSTAPGTAAAAAAEAVPYIYRCIVNGREVPWKQCEN